MNLVLILYLVIFLTACNTVPKLNYKTNKPELVIAMRANPEKQDALMLERTRAQEILSEILSVPVRIIIPSSNMQILNGFQDETIDLGYINAIDMYNAEKKNIASLLLAVEGSEPSYYHSYLLVKKDSSYQKIQDLKGKPIAFSSNHSASGYLIPYLNFINWGILKEKQKPEAFFGEGNVWFGDGYLSAVDRLLSGKADVAAVSDSTYDKAYMGVSSEKKKQLRILHVLKKVPSHIIAARKTLSNEQLTTLKKALIYLNRYSDLSEKIFYAELIEVDSVEHLEIIRDAFKKTGLSIETY